MKTPRTFKACLILALAIGGLSAARTRALTETNSVAVNAPPENLGCDFHEGKTNRIARVYAVTPACVQVIYEGGTGSRKIPRQSLPPELQEKYPYDAAQAAEYLKKQTAAAAAELAAQHTARRLVRQTHEDRIKAEIEKLQNQDRQLQGWIDLYAHMAGGNGRKRKLAELRNQRQYLRERILKLQEHLAVLEGRRDATR